MVRPFNVTRPNFRAESVLDLPAHTIFKSRTEVGDQLVIECDEAKKYPKPEPAEIPEVQLTSSAAAPEAGSRKQIVM
jgi:hypothetical protein